MITKKRISVPNNRNHRNLLFYYGNTNDYFCYPDIKLLSFERALFLELEEKGFNRIVFFDLNKGIYSFKEQYLQEFFGKSENNEIETGPLGKFNAKAFFSKYLINKSISLNKLLEICLKDNSFKTAIIFPNPSDLYIENIGESIFNYLKEQIKLLLNTLTNSENIIVFNFKEKRIDEIKNKINLLPIDKDEIVIFDQEFKYWKNCIPISFPEYDELYNLINYFRLRENIKVDWENLDTIINILQKQEMGIQTLFKSIKNFIENKGNYFILDQSIAEIFTYS